MKNACDVYGFCPYAAEDGYDCACWCGTGEDVADDPALWEE